MENPHPQPFYTSGLTSPGWDPWLYNPYWYAPMAYAYPDYSYDGSDDPPYRPGSSPDSSYNNDKPAGDLSPSSSNQSSNYNHDDSFDLNPGSGQDKIDPVQNSQTQQLKAAPNSPAPAAQPQP
jgi:hypothetical protein